MPLTQICHMGLDELPGAEAGIFWKKYANALVLYIARSSAARLFTLKVNKSLFYMREVFSIMLHLYIEKL